MQAEEIPETGRGFNKEVAAMVAEMSRIGPKIPEIARRLRRHKETVRYWYKKLEERGFAVQAMVNHEALGLKRLVFKIQLDEAYSSYVQPLMLALNELAYVVYYAKVLAENKYVMQSSVPTEIVPEYLSFMEALKDQGVIRSLEVYSFDWTRNIPMDGTYYDFEHGHWEFDLPSLVKKDVPFREPRASDKIRFDRIDLLIAKELNFDATREIQEIQRAIKERNNIDINYKTLCWHLKEHVEGNGLLKGYRINWMGTRWDPITERARHRSHSSVIYNIMVRRPTPDEKQRVMKMFNRLPLLWGEASGEDYAAEVALPSEMILDGLRYIQEVTDSISTNTSYCLLDQRNAMSFTFSYNLYDEATRSWTFNKQDLLAKFKALEIQIKGQ